MNSKVSFEGIGELAATFYHAEAEKGFPVMMSGGACVKNCNSGAEFIGVCSNVNAQTAQVQLHGYVRLPYTGSVPAVGFCALAANGSGGVTAAGSRKYLVLDVDTTDATVGFML